MNALTDFYESILLTVKRSFDYSGRSTRKEYWLFFLAYMIMFASSVALMGVLENVPILSLAIFAIQMVQIAMLIPGMAVGVRRLHDTDRAGWWLLLFLATTIGQIVLLVFLCQDGTASSNSFGPDPKGRDVSDIFS